MGLKRTQVNPQREPSDKRTVSSFPLSRGLDEVVGSLTHYSCVICNPLRTATSEGDGE